MLIGMFVVHLVSRHARQQPGCCKLGMQALDAIPMNLFCLLCSVSFIGSQHGIPYLRATINTTHTGDDGHAGCIGF